MGTEKSKAKTSNDRRYNDPKLSDPDAYQNHDKELIFDYSVHNKSAYRLPPDFLPQINLDELADNNLLREERPALPEVSEIDIVRHYTALSKLNYGIDNGFYPLGSCTMKYNPKINEEIAALEGFSDIHPYQDEEDIQGILMLLYNLERELSQVFGFHRFSLQPCAGAQGEYAGLLIMQAYHRDRGNTNKDTVLIPDSAHGTNPASVTGVGWKIQTVKSKNGTVDLDDLKKHIGPHVAGIMLTNPNTMGLFEKDITTIAEWVHGVDGLLYWDGANANAIMGYVKPPEVGFDICHLNLHKTFSTPHGGGGPGAGPVGVVSKLEKYLPNPRIEKDGERYFFDSSSDASIGRLHGHFGNIGILVRAWTYTRSLGSRGLKEASENTVLLANYLKKRLTDYYDIKTEGICKHEFVISLKRERQEFGIRAMDVAKRLIDYGFHPPTIYFPLNVSEALMIETPESETIDTIDTFADAMIAIHHEIRKSPDLLHNAPHNTAIGRLDEVKAVKEPKTRL
jgi:glycine dehydrogenase subunit 2